MKHPFLFSLILGLNIVHTAAADTTLEYWVDEGGAKQGKLQAVQIKDGKILVKGAEGGEGRDYLYSSAPEQFFVIDHRQRKTMALDENQINRIAKQTEVVQPLLQGLGEQIARLDPKQRAKWEGMLGGKGALDGMAAAAQPQATASIVKTGESGKVGGIACEKMKVFQGKKQTAEFCLADPAKMNMPQSDYAAIRSLLEFSERLASKTQGLAKYFGVSLPKLDLRDLAGVPVELREVSKNPFGLKLNRVATSEVAAELMQPPKDYPVGELKLW